MNEIVVGSLVVTLLVVAMTIALLMARRVLVPEGALVVTVNEDTRIEAARGDRLLSVLHGAGIEIPAACGGSGTCGLCRVTVTGEGAGEAQATEKGILSAAERRASLRLACQVNLRGPVDVTVPDAVTSARSFACPVVSNRMLAPLIREIVLELPDGHAMEFKAGSFMQISAPPYELDFRDIEVPDEFRDAWDIAGWPEMHARSTRVATRAYSIANRPRDAGQLVFNIRLAVPPAGQERAIPPGLVSSYLFSLRVGDQIDVSGPFGDFHVQSTDREIIFIGGGVGMAPLRAMVHEQIGSQTSRKLTYFYGARTVADIYYSEEFEAIAENHENFTWAPALSDPAPGDRWTGATCFIHELVRSRLQRHSAPEDCEYYLCGPPVMISAVLSTLSKLGIEKHSIFNDDFGV